MLGIFAACGAISLTPAHGRIVGTSIARGGRPRNRRLHERGHNSGRTKVQLLAGSRPVHADRVAGVAFWLSGSYSRFAAVAAALRWRVSRVDDCHVCTIRCRRIALVAGISASAQTPRLVTAAVLLAFVVSVIVSAPYAAWRKRVDTSLRDGVPRPRSGEGPISADRVS